MLRSWWRKNVWERRILTASRKHRLRTTPLSSEVFEERQLLSVSLVSGNNGRTGNDYSHALNALDPFYDSSSSISADGRYVVFLSRASDLTSDSDTNGDWDVFVRDMVSGSIQLVSKTVGGWAGGVGGLPYDLGGGSSPVISADGRWVAFVDSPRPGWFEDPVTHIRTANPNAFDPLATGRILD